MRVGDAIGTRRGLHREVRSETTGIVGRERLVGVDVGRAWDIVAFGIVFDPGQLLAYMGCPVPGIWMHVRWEGFTIRQRQVFRRDNGRRVQEVQVGLHDVRKATCMLWLEQRESVSEFVTRKGTTAVIMKKIERTEQMEFCKTELRDEEAF